ncbi:MAG: Fic family protein [Opitutaceae bacterium]|jgi:hypothetical protein
MGIAEKESRQEVGNLALARFVGAPDKILRRRTYVAGSRDREVTEDDRGLLRVERTLPLVYAPEAGDGMLGHVAFAMKHETVHLGLLAETFARIEPAATASYVAASPTGAYARRIGYLYELLTGREIIGLLPDARAIGGKYVPLLDGARMVTGAPQRVVRWKVEDNLPGNRDYSPTIERTPLAQAALTRDWAGEVARAVGGGESPELLKRALQYLYRKETKSSFEIEREAPSVERVQRFIATLEHAGRLSVEETLSEVRLAQLQRVIVDPRYAAEGFRTNQNYVGGNVRWEPVVHYVSPPPALLSGLMAGLAAAATRLAVAEPVAQAAVAAFGFVFHHPFEDGNGRIHRFLIHDTLVRRGVVPGGMALPVSAAILEDMAAYDRTLEAYSTVAGEVARYTLTEGGMLTVTNPDEAAWVWRYPDLTPQVEYLGRAMDKAVQMVPEEVNFLVRYDELWRKAKQVVDMPDARLANLLSKVHENGGALSNNKRKQRFKELTDSEVAQIEAAYADVFGLRSGRGEAEDADA